MYCLLIFFFIKKEIHYLYNLSIISFLSLDNNINNEFYFDYIPLICLFQGSGEGNNVNQLFGWSIRNRVQIVESMKQR